MSSVIFEKRAIDIQPRGSIRYTYHGNHSVVRRGDNVQPDFLQPVEFEIVPYAVSAVGL